MKNFTCACGHRVFFENTQCLNCKRRLGFDPLQHRFLALTKDSASGEWKTRENQVYKLCKNQLQYSVCNWLIPATAKSQYCLSCQLNEMIPAITAPKKRLWWGNMEAAKRRLLYTLLQLGLPVKSRKHHADGLAFAFMEDKRANPAVKEEYVSTGHANGLITVNLAEADDAARERTRLAMGEDYRTLLGHFRHESGHYYLRLLVRNTHFIDEFRHLFGDERQNYAQAIAKYYSTPPPPSWKTGYISDYAQAHPEEDWAECWAHYLHIIDTLDTAADFGIVECDPVHEPIDSWLHHWSRVTIILNGLNRSMGLRDAYPFVLSSQTLKKIRFVHRVACPK